MKCLYILHKFYVNDSLLKGTFTDSLKLRNKTPVHRDNEPTNKEDNQRVNIFALIIKIFERLNYDYLKEYLEQYLDILLCDFRKAHSLNMLYLKF